MEKRNNLLFSPNIAYQQDVLDNFNDRVQEIEKFFELLDKFHAVNPAQLISVDEYISSISEMDLNRTENVEGTVRNILRKLRLQTIEPDLINILKSNAVLLLYNLIESTISKADKFILDTVTEAKMTYSEASQKIKEFWVRGYLEKKGKEEKTLLKTIELLEGMNTIKIDVKKQIEENSKEFEGKLNAYHVDEILDKYGIEVTKAKMIRQESERIAVQNVAQWRSDLAHGKYSFADFGQHHLRYNSQDRDKTNDILFLKDSCLVFLAVFLENIEDYIEAKGYKKQ